MRARAMLPGGSSPVDRLRRRGKAVKLGTRAAAGGPLRRRAPLKSARYGTKAAARTARGVDTARLAQALALAARARPRRRITVRRVLVGIGVVGGGAALLKRLRSAREQQQEQVSEGPRVHTTPQEGHPAGEGPRTEREIGGPTSPKDETGSATGGAPGTPPDAGFEPHG